MSHEPNFVGLAGAFGPQWCRPDRADVLEPTPRGSAVLRGRWAGVGSRGVCRPGARAAAGAGARRSFCRLFRPAAGARPGGFRTGLRIACIARCLIRAGRCCAANRNFTSLGRDWHHRCWRANGSCARSACGRRGSQARSIGPSGAYRSVQRNLWGGEERCYCTGARSAGRFPAGAARPADRNSRGRRTPNQGTRGITAPHTGVARTPHSCSHTIRRGSRFGTRIGEAGIIPSRSSRAAGVAPRTSSETTALINVTFVPILVLRPSSELIG